MYAARFVIYDRNPSNLFHGATVVRANLSFKVFLILFIYF